MNGERLGQRGRIGAKQPVMHHVCLPAWTSHASPPYKNERRKLRQFYSLSPAADKGGIFAGA
jgi:hypothetical protein